MLPEKSIIRNQNLELQKNIYIALLVHWLKAIKEKSNPRGDERTKETV
jgi:hypothetical protein